MARFRVARQRVTESLVGQWLERLVEVQYIDRSVALAAKGFVSLLPLVVAVAAVAPESVREAITSALEHRLGLSGRSLELVRSGFESSTHFASATGYVGGLLLLFYAVSFTSALQRMFAQAWRRPPTKDRRRPVKGLSWLACMIVLVCIAGGLREVFTGVIGVLLFGVLTVIALTGVWWVTAFLMLQGHLRWRVLLPSALLTATGSVIYTATSGLWMPRAVLANDAQFGLFGVAMTLVSWFVGLAFIVVGATTVSPVLAYQPGALGRVMRGPVEAVCREGAPPELTPEQARWH
jgi:membrane protein